MSIQTTFRSVAKPKVKVLTAPLVAGELILDQATTFIFSSLSVGTISSLSGNEYLVDGQEVIFVNAHLANSLVINVGSYSKTIPAGYLAALYFKQSDGSFYEHRKHADLKPIEDNVDSNATAIANEISNRQADTATLYKLDGSRPLTGTMDLAGNFLVNVPQGASADHVINKAQFDTAVAAIQASISASANSLQWRSKVDFVTKRTSGSIPVNGDALLDSTFGAGNARLFEDDDAPTQTTTATIIADSTVVFLKDGLEPKKMIVRDVLGTKRWYDQTETDPALKLDRQITANDTFIVENDLLGEEDSRETQSIYYVQSGSPKTLIKLGDFDWNLATGVSISSSYVTGAGDQTVVQGDSIQQAIQKLDGNIEKNKTDGASALSAAIAQEVSDRNSAISGAIAQEVSDRDNAIYNSQLAQDNKLASVVLGDGSALIGINDAGNHYLGSTVEEALQQIGEEVNTAEQNISTLQTDVANHATQLQIHTDDIADLAGDLTAYENSIASTSSGQGASLVGIADTAGNLTSTNVEDALQEINTKVENLNHVTLHRGVHQAAVTGGTTLDLTTDFVDQLTGGTVQDLSSASYLNVFVNRDGAMLINRVGFTISGNTLTLTAGGGGILLKDEIVEVTVIKIV